MLLQLSVDCILSNIPVEYNSLTSGLLAEVQLRLLQIVDNAADLILLNLLQHNSLKQSLSA